MLNDDPLWYKDAIIYELHVKAFFDGNDDGVGDFRGLLQKLDYLQSLGVTCIWLLPFYPSPQRDDGYDIADYRNVHPGYGTLRDFRDFVREAHARGMRVLTELVINHTSDQHPWFQRARRAPAGSKARDWYVWSKSDQKYADTRIIFTDTEASNWTWDAEAQAYYWHRFFSHQPDLNFQNPQVVKSVVDVMRFWLDAGVDALRLDAIPYLCEREGTNNENLPETHVVLKNLRSALDERHKNRMFLAEANQWPEDVQAYFGDGDECHMAYHFPLMPRMYMAIAQEDRHPVTDILRQTPDIPENCQWAIFLRNHDELTLEMVTDSERDYLWTTYAADKRARINLGIRRRLAPLMDNDRRKIELMNSLLMSLPGTPIIYYGDEIGMGDNFFLGDRNGVRTPMQWTLDRNGGFSRADPAHLFLPPLMDPLYGYQSINVEAQLRSPSSLLNWMRRLIAVRQNHRVFGRGDYTLLYPDNRRILAYVRQYEHETALCVANLSRSAQAFSLDLSQFRGKVPVELMGRSPFPMIRDGEYELSLQGYSFYWFMLQDVQSLATTSQPVTELAPEYSTLILGETWNDLFSGRSGDVLLQHVLPRHLPRQRWFRAKNARVRSVNVVASTELKTPDTSFDLTLLETKFTGDEPSQRYLLPLALNGTELRLQPPVVQSQAIAKTRKGPREGVLYDATADDRFILDVVERIRHDDALPFANGKLHFKPTEALSLLTPPEQMSVRHIGAEQSNTTVLIEDNYVLKFYRAVEPGVQPEIEMGRYLTDVAHFANTPALLGSVEIRQANGGRPSALGIMHAFVRNQGDGWTFTVNYVDRHLDESVLLTPEQISARSTKEAHTVYLNQVTQLGIRTAEMHRALCPERADAAFLPEPVKAADIAGWVKRVRAEARSALAGLRRAGRKLPSQAADMAARLLDGRSDVLDRIGGDIPQDFSAMKIRTHGDYHLGQVLVAQNDFYIIDFEGEPRRPMTERRHKDIGLRDVAGMLRSFDYAAWAAYDQTVSAHPENSGDLMHLATSWRDLAQDRFLSAYRETMLGSAAMPDSAAAAESLLRLFIIEKAFYELQYELANRPAWISIPLRGVIETLFGKAEG